jgi:GH18 family chitinase
MDDEDNKPKLTVLQFKKPEQTETDADINPDKVLEAALGKLKSAIVIGWTDSGGFYLAMSQGAIAENLMLLETSKAMIIEYMLGGIDADE